MSTDSPNEDTMGSPPEHVDQQESDIVALARARGTWGIATSIDIYECDAETIRDQGRIGLFVAELCDLIKMKAFGQPRIVHFGEDERVAGYSMVQLIETSLISAHFANQTNTVYLDVFSCKLYEPDVVADFAQVFFGGTRPCPRIWSRTSGSSEPASTATSRDRPTSSPLKTVIWSADSSPCAGSTKPQASGTSPEKHGRAKPGSSKTGSLESARAS